MDSSEIETVSEILQNFDWFRRHLLLVASSPRGGSTFTAEVIGRHPDILHIPWNDKVLHQLWPARNIPIPEFRDKLLREPTYFDQSILEARLGSEKFVELEKLILSICTHRKILDLISFQGLLYWLKSCDGAKLNRYKYWIIKTNTFRNVDQLVRERRTTRLVFLQRDPRSVALSLAKVRAKRQRFEDLDVLVGSVDWVRQFVGFYAVSRKVRESVHWLRYEDLVVDSYAAIQNMTQILGLANVSKEDWLQLVSQVAQKKTRSVYDNDWYYAIEKAGKQELGINLEGLERWRDGLTGEQLAVVHRITHGFARQLGYVYDHPGRAPVMRLACQKRSLKVLIYQWIRFAFAQVHFVFISAFKTRESAIRDQIRKH